MADSYIDQGQTEVFFVEEIDNPAAPTAAEINAGIAVARFGRVATKPSTQGNSVDATPMGAKNASSLDGLPGITNATLTFLTGDTPTADSVVLFHTFEDLVKTSGFLVFAPRGRIGVEDDEDGEVSTGDLVHVYPGKVNTVTLDSNGAQDPATATVSFTHSGAHHPAVTVAAS